MYLLSGQHDVDGDELATAVRRVAAYREVMAVSLSEVLDGYATLAQSRWAAWRRKHRLEERLPQDFGVVQRAFLLADRALSGASRGQTWHAGSTAWVAR
ncbi:hypothetical protein G3559_15960 [Micromonospora sp. PPF5-17B]|nr:hypothetical protein [Micromonospora sp. PPF5-17B]NES15220.1 hypothetical protein [Micromonospora sp. PPF5-17B]